MFKIFSVIFLTFLLVGCNNLSISSSDNPKAIERAMSSVDSENEVIGVGSAPIESSGTLVASGKASQEAKKELKSKILSEEEIVFQSFLIPADQYTKKILSPAISDLMDYTATQLIQKAIVKDSWTENNHAYIVFSVSKAEILSQSQSVFIQYITDIIKKFQVIKEGVSQPQ